MLIFVRYTARIPSREITPKRDGNAFLEGKLDQDRDTLVLRRDTSLRLFFIEILYRACALLAAAWWWCGSRLAVLPISRLRAAGCVLALPQQQVDDEHDKSGQRYEEAQAHASERRLRIGALLAAPLRVLAIDYAPVAPPPRHGPPHTLEHLPKRVPLHNGSAGPDDPPGQRQPFEPGDASAAHRLHATSRALVALALALLATGCSGRLERIPAHDASSVDGGNAPAAPIDLGAANARDATVDIALPLGPGWRPYCQSSSDCISAPGGRPLACIVEYRDMFSSACYIVEEAPTLNQTTYCLTWTKCCTVAGINHTPGDAIAGTDPSGQSCNLGILR